MLWVELASFFFVDGRIMLFRDINKNAASVIILIFGLFG